MLIAVFIQLVYRDVANKAEIAHLKHLISINNDELLALEGGYYHFSDDSTLKIKEHYYAADLDILGHASVFQFLNRTGSEQGAAQLANWLLKPSEVDSILARQDAVKELRTKNEWRQHFEAYGKEKKITHFTLERLQHWIQQPSMFIKYKPWQVLRYFLPAIILSISALCYFDYLSMQFFYGSLFVFSVIAFQVNKFVAPIHEQLSKMVDELENLAKRIELIETEHFRSPLLTELQQQCAGGGGKASLRIKQLKKLLDRLDIRYNIVISAPLNLFLLWNLQQVLDLEKWKTAQEHTIGKWFETLGKFEVLNSFTTLHFNHPAWVFPSLLPEHFSIEATELGHPLIPPSKRVNNFIGIPASSEVMLVTGSNMAGKSTYLRSVGVNVVLAMAGAPVCATIFKLSPVQLISSMRIADNLEESTSTFYAELKKLKTVIDKVNNKEKVFVLLDEILRGTNSFDRHTGSVALVKQLIGQRASAILATHDLELARMEKEFPSNILNYHFDVQVNNEELYFDYRLKAGVCTSMNASILMKKIGINL